MDTPLNKAFTFDIQGKTIKAAACISDAIDKMESSRKTCLLVEAADGKPMGIISEHDIVIAFARKGGEAITAKVRDYMMLDVIAVKENDTVNDALRLMAVHNIRHLPVLSGSGKILDFLSVMDLIGRKMA